MQLNRGGGMHILIWNRQRVTPQRDSQSVFLPRYSIESELRISMRSNRRVTGM